MKYLRQELYDISSTGFITYRHLIEISISCLHERHVVYILRKCYHKKYNIILNYFHTSFQIRWVYWHSQTSIWNVHNIYILD
jgi:hypothetical protein